MPMDAFQFLFLASLVLLHRAMGDDSETEVIGAVGGSVTFHIHDLAGDAAFWHFGNVPIVTVEFSEPPVTVFSDNKYKTRLTISEQGRALTISQLTMEDAGTYSALNPKAKSTFTLHVYSELAEPRVSCEAQNCSAGGCRYGLRCALPGAGDHSPGLGNVSYGWSVGEQPRGEGPTVLVEESPPEESVPLTCWARNPVSSRNVTVRPAELCAGTDSIPLAVIIALTVTAAVALSAVALFYCRSKGWRIFHLSATGATDTEARQELTTVYAQVNHCQQSISNRTRDNPKGGETSRTIYSTVKAPAQTDDEKMVNSTLGAQEADEKSSYSLVI
ncbi:SLAM family member 7-like [Myiozetetes cayanensis]|uniref:SLAM family member 7-like n=1 Tax=Myiozetetes cayanensis TaxID=478635 RepID=UPI0021604FA5|nr:SLAM family member 7-like [Myiozetetes cayanensis]